MKIIRMLKDLFKRSHIAKAVLISAAVLVASNAQAATHIFASKLITSEDSKMQSDKTVIVENNKIGRASCRERV